MKFGTFKVTIELIRFIFGILIAFYLNSAIFPQFQISFIVQFIIVILVLIVYYVIAAKPTNYLLNRSLTTHFLRFLDNLQASELDGVVTYFNGFVMKSRDPIVKSRNAFNAFYYHTKISNEPYQFIDQVSQIVESSKDVYSIRILFVYDAIATSYVRNGDLESALKTYTDSLDYCEQIIDGEKYRENELQFILNHTSILRHIIRFINSTNVRTAGAIKTPRNNNFERLCDDFFFAKVFTLKGMKEDAQPYLDRLKEYQGNLPILDTAKGLIELN